MKSFKKYLENRMLSEESREERANREMEAKRRLEKLDNHYDDQADSESNKPPENFGSPEWKKWADQHKQSPLEDFMDDTLEEIEKITGKSFNYGELIDPMASRKSSKDHQRIIDLISDFHDDGTSVNQAAQMAVKLIKSMGYQV